MTLSDSRREAQRFQTIPVPDEHVPAVLAFLGNLIANGTAQSPDDADAAFDQTGRGPAVDGWTDEQLIRFATMRARTSQTFVKLTDLLVQSPGKDAARSTREVARELGVAYQVMKAFPTHVSRVVATHFPGLSAPYWGLWGTTDFTPSRGEEMYYAVTEGRAEQWLRVRSVIARATSDA